MYSHSLKPSDHWITQPKTWVEFSRVLRTDEKIWEPFVCKSHHISKETWEKNGFECIETESDFFTTEMPATTTCLISNPPFSRKFDVLDKCFHLNLKFALLLPSWVFASSTFRKLIKKYGINDLSLIIPSKRVHYINPESMEIGKKTNFDSIFITRCMIEPGIYYL